ncbi:unnamed protein product [Trichobilharzia szidati]|nr:unnamed protein product [Trichobilharzia szidati]
MDEVIFVTDPASILLNAAYEAVSGYENINPKRIGSCEVTKLYPCKPSKDVCFVLARFEGKCYEHLRSLGVSIYGPQVILHYVRENKALPNLPYPLFSTALMNATATVTSVTGVQRKQIFDSIQMLHGTVSRDLTDNVNVVVTAKVGSKKYLVGASRNLHILLPDWISEAWRLSEIQDPIDMMLPIYTEKFRVPIFSQLVICVSGLSVEERKEVADLVTKHGGSYSGVMKIGETTHLITQQASGTKYVHAKKWKIQIINIQWLIDSVSRGYALDEEEYRVDQSNAKSSTPASNTSQNSISFRNISAISYIGDVHTKVDETKTEFSHRESVQVSNAKNNLHILSGCVIMLSDCSKDEVQSYSLVIKELGGKLCTDLHDQVTENLTHVIVGDVSSFNFKSKEKDVMYVRGEWLLACQSSGLRLPEDNYLIKDADTDCQKMEDNLDNATMTNMDATDLQLINQYFADGGFAEADDFQNDFDETKQLTKGINEKSTQRENINDAKQTDVTEVPQISGCFSRLSFSFHEELSSEDVSKYSSVITASGGSISRGEQYADFMVTPFFVLVLPVVPKSCQFVTTAWISHCVHEKSLCIQDISREYAFKPLIRKPDPPPLSGCVISLSGFVGNDRNLLTSYAQALGAIVQECFLRKSVVSRNLSASTHLVAAKPDGRKWPAAKQWGLPAVNRMWLYKCAEMWSLVDESKFLVSDATDTSDGSNSKDTAVNSKTVGPPDIMPDRKSLKEIQFNNPTNSESNDSLRKSMNGKPNESFECNLALSNLAETMQTPDWVRNANGSHMPNSSHDLSSSYRPSPPLSVQVSRCLKNAVRETSALPKRKLELSDDEGNGLCLQGVVICVAKHLSSRQVELNGIVRKLGGDFKWTYNSQMCTHMISETTPEEICCPPTPISGMLGTPGTTGTTGQSVVYADVTAAKQDGKFLVSPKWLISCMEAGKRLPENDFPPTLFDRKTSVNTSPAEPKAKIARVASVNLLGDVNRRLEMMIGGGNKCKSLLNNNYPQNGTVDTVKENVHSTTNNTNNNNGTDQHILNTDLLNEFVQDQGLENGDFMNSPFPAIPMGQQRRIRRNPRRGKYSNLPHADINNTSYDSMYDNNNNNINNNDNGKQGTDANGNIDLMQAGQMITVRWKYDDDTPGPTTTTTATASSSSISSTHNTDALTFNPNIEIQNLNQGNLSHRPPDNSTVSMRPPFQQQPVSSPPKPSYVISFTGLPSDERDHYTEIVERLGGEVDNQGTLSEKATHLIVHTPTRSEKCLICLATGKWMLHKAYLDACSRESRWLDETPFEWGGPGTEPLLMQLSPFPIPGANVKLTYQQQQAAQIRELARSARRWRLAGGKAFQGWKVIFGPGCDKESSFRRVIEAGGGKVLASNPPFPPASEVTHAFFKPRNNSTNTAAANNNNNSSSNALSALPREYSWLRIDYLCAYLSTGQEISKADYML